MVDLRWQGRNLLLGFALFGLVAGTAAGFAADSPKLQLVDDEEPGEPMWVQVTVTHSDGETNSPLEWTVYQTDARGYYRQDASGRELGGPHARLIGKVKPSTDGRFVVQTIRPAPYPGGGVPAHIHFVAEGPDGRAHSRTLHFSDDPNLPESGKISTGRRPVCAPARQADDSWICRVDLVVDP